MLKYPRNISVERLQNYLSLDGQFADVTLASFLKALVSQESVKLAKYSVPGLERISFSEAMKGNYLDTSVGVSLGPTWSTHWFRVDITVPASFAGQRVTLIFDSNSEAMIWSEKGETLCGLTGGSGDTRHVDFDLLEKAQGGEKIRLWIEVAANSMFGEGQITMIGPTNPNVYFTLRTAEIVVFNEDAQSLYWDLDVLLGIAKEMPEDSQLANDALYTANKIVNTIFPSQPETILQAKEIANAFFEERRRNGSFVPHHITAIGNCHIDTAWLWPYDETKRKVARSWSTQCRFLEQFPEYTFAASQTQQFEWTEQLYPELFQRIQKLTKEGRFIPIGGTWVEMDCNIPSGEAFCRQFLYGQSYLKEKFGFYSSVFWLPDTFGYASQLPQIVRAAGLKYFFTQKLSWNNINKFPHTSFYWKGLDGTSVLTHFSPADTYTAQASVKDLTFMVKNNKDKRFSNKSLLLYGNGDGGGGPLRPMLERIKRFRNVEDLPAGVSFGNPEVFYDELEKSSRELNTWQGELYFELHRGTYTSHGLVKKYNRKCEFLLREVEMLWSLAIAQKLTPFASYPKQELDRIWKLLLLNQFHDVLPGSSIHQVYVDAHKFFEDIVRSGTKLKEQATALLVDIDPNAKTCCYFNSTSWTRKNTVVPSAYGSLSADLQATAEANAGVGVVQEIRPLSFRVVSQSEFFNAKGLDPVTVESDSATFTVDNGIIKVVLDRHGRILEYFDHANNRPIVPEGSMANVFRFYEDIPLFWDAWDVEIYHLEKGFDAAVGALQVVETGPLRVVLKVVHPLSAASTLDQRIIVNAGSSQVVFENDLFWNENRKILKVEFPVAIQNDNATFETQYGFLQRPTHSNSSWDMAKFEVCAHKFVDLSEYGYGVALLNDCKYGFSVRGNVIAMSILRSPKAPDDSADIGRHTFKYALQPHGGSFLDSNVVQKGYEFNIPEIAVPGRLKSPMEEPFFQLDCTNLVIDCVKKAERKDCFVVRLFEAYGGRGSCVLSSAFAIASVCESNILEDGSASTLPLLADQKSFRFAYLPFKLFTFMVSLK
ncbi:Alpha-mannosidase 2C1 [Kappamyces sp. JEL0680]|nr:Alpha-mannosidase 2C1 [Kappamyces sp. JEL0680]